MKSLSLPRLLLLAVALLFVLASCGGDEESSAATPTTAATTVPTETAGEEPTSVEEATSVPVTEETTSAAPDERTEQEIAVDRLDLMMVQLGIEELEDFENNEQCVVERLASENVEFTGEGTADLIALAACDESIISAWLPATNPALSNETWACTVESIGDWIGELSIADAEAFFGTPSPPQEFIEQTADRCNATPEQIAAAF